MTAPGLTIEAAGGVQKVTIHFDRGDREGGFKLLTRVASVLLELDRQTRLEEADN